MAGHLQGQGGSTESGIGVGPMFCILKDGDDVQMNTFDESMSDNDELLGQLVDDNDSEKMNHDDDSNSNDNAGDNKVNGVSAKPKVTPKRMKRKPKKTKFTNADLVKKTIPKRIYHGRTGNIREGDRWIYDRLQAYDPKKDGTQVVVQRQLKWRCNTCLSTMVTKSGLFHHNLLHTGEKPYICKFENCGVGYTQSASRMVHEMNHTKFGTGARRNSYKSMRVAEDKKDLQVIDDYIKRAQKSPSPPKLHPETTLIRSNGISENLTAKNGQGSGSASSKIAIKAPTTTTSQKKNAEQHEDNDVIIIESSPSPSLSPPPRKKMVRQLSSHYHQNDFDQIINNSLDHSTGQSSDPGPMPMPSSQFEELKRFIQFSILESESRMGARMNDIEVKMGHFNDQLRIHEGKIDFIEKKIDFLAKQQLSLK